MSNLNRERVIEVNHWTDRLFSFTTTRDRGFRFLNGQFTMVGLEVDGRPLMRAYSMVSANHDDRLEFLSIKVTDGPLTSRLQHVRTGDTVLIGRKATGTLLLDNLLPGRRLYMLGTGTGLAPFMSLIRDPEVYERFESVVLVHGCRWIADLAYLDRITRALPEDDVMGGMIGEKLIYYPTVTREPFRHVGRITTLLQGDRLTADIGLPPLDPANDRVMLCGGAGYARRPADAARRPRLQRRQPERARPLRHREGVRREVGQAHRRWFGVSSAWSR